MSVPSERTVRGETLTVSGVSLTVELYEGILVVRAGNVSEDGTSPKKLMLVIDGQQGEPEVIRPFELYRRRRIPSADYPFETGER